MIACLHDCLLQANDDAGRPGIGPIGSVCVLLDMCRTEVGLSTTAFVGPVGDRSEARLTFLNSLQSDRKHPFVAAGAPL